MPLDPSLALLLLGALAYGFLNGLHDSANLVATSIASRAISPRLALSLTGLLVLAAPFAAGLAVARSLGTGMVDPAQITVVTLAAALAAAVGWNLLTWRLAIPSSSSHALVGGLLGALIASAGWEAIRPAGLTGVLAALVLSPVVGLAFGYLAFRLVYLAARGATPRVNDWFRRAQVVGSLALALSHGANDAQKTMAIIGLALVATGASTGFLVPNWAVAASASALALGTMVGGWRLIRTLGGRMYKVRPVHGFSSVWASAAVVLGAAVLGGPVSTTHVVSATVIGAGAAERLNMVRWSIAVDMLIAWVFTIPSTALLAAGLYWIMQFGR